MCNSLVDGKYALISGYNSEGSTHIEESGADPSDLVKRVTHQTK